MPTRTWSAPSPLATFSAVSSTGCKNRIVSQLYSIRMGSLLTSVCGVFAKYCHACRCSCGGILKFQTSICSSVKWRFAERMAVLTKHTCSLNENNGREGRRRLRCNCKRACAVFSVRCTSSCSDRRVRLRFTRLIPRPEPLPLKPFWPLHVSSSAAIPEHDQRRLRLNREHSKKRPSELSRLDESQVCMPPQHFYFQFNRFGRPRRLGPQCKQPRTRCSHGRMGCILKLYTRR